MLIQIAATMVLAVALIPRAVIRLVVGKGGGDSHGAKGIKTAVNEVTEKPNDDVRTVYEVARKPDDDVKTVVYEVAEKPADDEVRTVVYEVAEKPADDEVRTVVFEVAGKPDDVYELKTVVDEVDGKPDDDFVVAGKPYDVYEVKTAVDEVAGKADNVLKSVINDGAWKHGEQPEYLDKLYPRAQPAFFRRSEFPQDFVFGSATAAFQIEGGLDKHCRGQTTWDKFAKEHDLFKPYGPDAVNHVENLEEDVKLMKEIGFDSYKFSISWSRILPCGRGIKSQDGIKFYKNLIKTLKAHDIEPFVTLFHWDLPLDLQNKYHGFLSREIVDDYGDYAKICFEEFGDDVNYWITMNEPYSYAFSGHVNNVHAAAYGTVTDQYFYSTASESVSTGGCRMPNYRPPAVDCLKTREKVTVFCPPCTEKFSDPFAFPYVVTHNMLLAHGQAVKEFRKYQSCKKAERADKKIGITLVSMWFEPRDPDCGHDKAAARRALDFFLGWYLNPLVHGQYPESMQQYVKTGHLPEMTKADQKLIQGSYDFIGVNYYTARYVGYKVSKAKHLKDGRNYITDQHLKYYETRVLRNGKDVVLIGEKGSSAWLISHPKGIEKLLLHIKAKYKDPVIYITGNGLDDKDDGCTKQWSSLGDQNRMICIRDHLKHVLCAIKKGVKVKGYFAWSLFDNFEWESGFTVRFGLVYVDYKDGSKRYPKLSAQWFKHFLASDRG